MASNAPGLSLREFSISESDGIREIVSRIREKNEVNKSLSQSVSEIISNARTGDRAILELSRKYDKTSFSNPEDLLVTQDELAAAYSRLNREQINALRQSYKQIRFLAQRQKTERFGAKRYRTPFGFYVNESYVPLERIGGYIPGGLAAYPSTVLMICGPAREAGVKDIVLATPPRRDGSVNDATLAAADICGIKEIVKLGGAQAIAALAYGTESVKKVELIAGPGNQFVTEAKRQVSDLVSIDSLAGPTELLIIADKKADARLVFEDIVSQAEHGNRTLCGVVSDSESLLRPFKSFLDSLKERKRLEHIAQSFIFAIKSRTIGEAFEFAQAFASEHLEVQVFNGKNIRKLTRSGVVLVGKYAPCSSTDYVVGTNHILPTGGLAARSAGVSVETFLKRVTFVESSFSSLKKSRKTLSILAELEGLPNHVEAVNSRFRNRDNNE
ncbi:MAG: histidinol dehydrogenase [Nitrososphaerales archaeon]